MDVDANVYGVIPSSSEKISVNVINTGKVLTFKVQLERKRLIRFPITKRKLYWFISLNFDKFRDASRIYLFSNRSTDMQCFNCQRNNANHTAMFSDSSQRMLRCKCCWASVYHREQRNEFHFPFHAFFPLIISNIYSEDCVYLVAWLNHDWLVWFSYDPHPVFGAYWILVDIPRYTRYIY